MKSLPKWLLVPPAAALLLVLGPLSMQGSGRTEPVPPPASAPAEDEVPAAATRSAPRTTNLPRTPDMFEMGSALIGVLLLGAGAVLLLRKLRGGASPTGGATLVTLRQSLRLSARQTIHALEFDDRILLVGETDRGLALLESGRAPERAADEAEVMARAARVDTTVGDDDEDGAVPRNLVLPRPAGGPARRLPTPPRSHGASAAAPAPATLSDFRNLLQKAGRA